MIVGGSRYIYVTFQGDPPTKKGGSFSLKKKHKLNILPNLPGPEKKGTVFQPVIFQGIIC